MLDGGLMDGGSTEIVLVGGQHSWQEIDRDLRMIAKRQRALDADEVALLCVASRMRIWEELGKASLLEYLEDIFGYGPKVAYGECQGSCRSVVNFARDHARDSDARWRWDSSYGCVRSSAVGTAREPPGTRDAAAQGSWSRDHRDARWA